MTRHAQAYNANARRGSVYLLALAMATLLTVTGIAGVMLLRTNRASMTVDDSIIRARSLAEGGIELALARIAADADWRSSMSDGQIVTGASPADGHSVFVVATDPDDGSLTDDPTDPVVLLASALAGGSRQGLRVETTAESVGYGSMGAAIHAGGNLTSWATSVTAAPYLSAGNEVYVDTERIYTFGQHEVAGSMISIGPRELAMPDAAAARAELLAEAEPISYVLLDEGEMDEIVLSAQSNPYGAASARGIYSIDCGGRPITIKDSVIYATLVILNPGAGSLITGDMHWQPSRPTDPALVCFGTMVIAPTGENVEADEIEGRYIHEDDEERLDDHEDSHLAGFFYIGGNLGVGGSLELLGTIVSGGDVHLSGEVVALPQTDFAERGVTGFVSHQRLVITPGGWRRVTR
jgi:hypothetical protein